MEVLGVHAAMQGADRESCMQDHAMPNTTEALKIIRQLENIRTGYGKRDGTD